MENQSILFSAAIRILAPLVRIFLRNGISYGTFSALVKEAYVKVAMEDFTIEGRKQSISRVSVLTGLHRKEVKKIQENIVSGNEHPLQEKCNRAARVISGWQLDLDFLDINGRPAQLPVKGNGVTFETLVKRFSGNMPARAILDELERVGAVTQEDGRVQLVAKAYLPKGDEDMKLHILGTDVGSLIATIDHNLRNDQEQAYLQRKVFYDNLPQEALAQFRELSKAKAQTLLDELDHYLAQQDRDTNPERTGTGRHTAGVGIYYFERQTQK